MDHLRNLILASAAALGLGSCVYVPLDYYPPPPRPNRYLEGPPPGYRDRYARPYERPLPRERYRNRYRYDRSPRYDRERPYRDEEFAEENDEYRSIPSEAPDDLSPRVENQKPADLPKSGEEKPSSQKNSNAPKATRSDKPGRVKSPFPPYGELDVTGLQSGSLAKDPTSGKVFRVP